MVPFIIYWFALLVGFAWILFSLFELIFYTVKRENGNLWFIVPLNLVCVIILAIILIVYRMNDGFEITQFSSMYFAEIFTLLAITVLDVVLGRTKEEQA